ncbi:MAG: ATP-binding cassette domain-containing protein [Candidatus Omnitrophica bacterium]|nr:ATP-binding cassette domain-containing protein [Candidatus Omnitrophota bacterium]
MISVESLTMKYGSFTALDKVSFQAKEKEIVGLLGPNGAGKTTAMRIITTYLHPSSGTVKIEDQDAIENPIEVRKLIGYLPETAPLYPDMMVDEYLRFVGEARELEGSKLAVRLKWVKEACGLGPVWKHTISELSKGYKQRTGLAQALIHDPKVLVLDEPTSGLDPLQVMGIRELIKELSKQKTIIFSTHILQEVEAVAHRIVIINEGKIVSQGTQKELESQVRGLGETSPYLNLEKIFIALLTKNKKSKKEPIQV